MSKAAPRPALNEFGPDWAEHNWLIVALAARGDSEEAIKAIQDCWAEIKRLRQALIGISALGAVPKADLGDAIGYAEEALENHGQ